jgi:hypothetical protein
MHTILDLVFDWLVFGLGVPILIGTGFALLADEVRQFTAAKVCFTVAAVWVFGKVAMWGIATSEKFSVRAGVTALVCAIVGVGLVEAIRLTANREAAVGRSESTQITAPAVPPVAAPDTREFTNRTPRELLGFYRNVTTLQGDSLIAPFKGLWIKVAGKVESVVDAGGARAQVVLKDHEGTMCTCTFQPRWTNALRRLSKNDEISATGKIFEGQNGSTLYLADCDLVEPSPKNANASPPQAEVSPKSDTSESSSPLAINSQKLRSPGEPKQTRANLKVEATKLGKIYLQGDIWTLAPGAQSKEVPFRGLLIDVANVPTQSWNIKAVTVKAALTIQSRSYSPLPWLEEYTNTVRLEPAARKTIVLAAGHDRAMGSWHFVLNHRDNYNSVADPSRMDWTNMAPIPSNLRLEVLLVDVNSGELTARFEYLWTFDANLNWVILKAP